MSQGRILAGLGAMVVAGLLVSPVLAQTAAAPAPAPAAAAGPNTGAVSFDVNVDVPTKYQFRGVVQQDQGFIIQPGLTATVKLYEGENILESLDWYAGIWTSFHSDQSGHEAAVGPLTGNKAWYEADLYTGVAIGLPYGIGADLSYIAYTYPSGAAATIHEADLKLTYDDKDLMAGMGMFALNPYALFAFEIDNQGGNQRGYFEAGLEPSFVVLESESYPVTLSVPVKLGLSLYDYYADLAQTFGYILVGVDFSVPLAFIPSEYGAWDFSAGVNFLFADTDVLGGAAALGQAQDNFEPIGVFGLAMSY